MTISTSVNRGEVYKIFEQEREKEEATEMVAFSDFRHYGRFSFPKYLS